MARYSSIALAVIVLFMLRGSIFRSEFGQPQSAVQRQSDSGQAPARKLSRV